MMTREQIQWGELVEDIVAIARGKPLKPEGERYPYADPSNAGKDCTTDYDRAMARYFKLALRPGIIATAVCEEPYTGQEVSVRIRSSAAVDLTEARRLAMTAEHVADFALCVDRRCRDAYAVKAAWFIRCLRGNRGRDQLYVWVRHWLCAYLADPESFRVRLAKGI